MPLYQVSSEKTSSTVLTRYGKTRWQALLMSSRVPDERFCRVEELRLLSKLEQAGLLSALEKRGLTLSYIEQAGLLSKAEKLGVPFSCKRQVVYALTSRTDIYIYCCGTANFDQHVDRQLLCTHQAWFCTG